MFRDRTTKEISWDTTRGERALMPPVFLGHVRLAAKTADPSWHGGGLRYELHRGREGGASPYRAAVRKLPESRHDRQLEGGACAIREILLQVRYADLARARARVQHFLFASYRKLSQAIDRRTLRGAGCALLPRQRLHSRLTWLVDLASGVLRGRRRSRT